MGLWDDVKKAARDAAERPGDLRGAFRDVRRQARGTPGAPPTLIMDGGGEVHVERASNSLVLLGRSLMLLAVSLMTMGLAWLSTAVLAFYLFLQKLFGLRVRVA